MVPSGSMEEVNKCWRLSPIKVNREKLNPAFALQRHTAPTAGVMIWGAIAYNTRSPLVLIRGTMTAQWYVHDILQPHVLPLMQWLKGAIFLQDNA
ncbi:transposable element Tcb2 transposase [Trichonephila clavipes]|nr:transposable element Tcb2 transposase [Trichonephila clavipes]